MGRGSGSSIATVRVGRPKSVSVGRGNPSAALAKLMPRGSSMSNPINISELGGKSGRGRSKKASASRTKKTSGASGASAALAKSMPRGSSMSNPISISELGKSGKRKKKST